MLLHTNYTGLEKLQLIESELEEKIDIIPYLWCKHGGTEVEIAPMRITDEEMEVFYDKYPFPKKENRYFSCNAGRYKISIDPCGNVKPCNAFSENYCVGNIKQDSIKEIWFSNNTFLQMRKAIRYPIAECRRCEKNAYCVLCPAIATWEGKNFGEVYRPMCEYAEVAKRKDNENM